MLDIQLLKNYTENGSEAAFSQLVARHLKLVYSTCLRETYSPSQAEDAAQVVFLILAQKAKSLRVGPSLSGWLYQTARFVAKDVRKQEVRRQRRDQTIMQESATRPEPTSTTWERIEPLLNDALSALKPPEREAVLLRYFDELSLAETGAALGVSEDAARMRVTRALEKLQRYLTAHGAAVTGVVLAGLLTAEAARPVSAHAAAIISQGTIQAISTGPTASIMLLSKGVSHTIKLAKVKFATLAAGLLLTGAATQPILRALSPNHLQVQIAFIPVTSKTPNSQSSATKTFVLQHLLPAELVKSQLWDQPGRLPPGVTEVKPLTAQNALSVTATPVGFAAMKAILGILDTEHSNLKIKISTASASDAEIKALGINVKPISPAQAAAHPEPLICETGSPAVNLRQMLSKRGSIIQLPDITTANDVNATIKYIDNSPSGGKVSRELKVNPHINQDNSLTLVLRSHMEDGRVKRESQAMQTVKNGETVAILLPPSALQSDRKNALFFINATIK